MAVKCLYLVVTLQCLGGGSAEIAPLPSKLYQIETYPCRQIFFLGLTSFWSLKLFIERLHFAFPHPYNCKCVFASGKEHLQKVVGDGETRKAEVITQPPPTPHPLFLSIYPTHYLNKRIFPCTNTARGQREVKDFPTY